MRRRYQRTLAYRNNVRDAESMKHVHVRRMIPIDELDTDLGAKIKKADSQIPQIQEGQHSTRKTPIEPWIIEPRLMVPTK